MKRKLTIMAIVVGIIIPILAGYFLITSLWMDSSKLNYIIDQDTKRLNENNRAYLTRLMEKCNLQAYTEDFYINSDTQLIGKISSIEFEDNKTKLGIGGKTVFNLNNDLVAAKSLRRLDDNNNQLDEIPLNEFSAREILEVLIPGNWVRMDKGPNGPATLIVYCHEQ